MLKTLLTYCGPIIKEISILYHIMKIVKVPVKSHFLFSLQADAKGLSKTISGWVFGSFALTQFIFSPIFGKMVINITCYTFCSSVNSVQNVKLDSMK